MAFTEERQPYERWEQFSFFASGGENGVVTESINEGVRFKIDEIRLHLSVAFASVEDFTVRLSSIKGSAHNYVVLSQAMNGVLDVLLQPSSLYFLSDDQVVFTLSLASGTNVVGINVIGWAVRG